jgi:glycosyltransferase involved in cell wall biosynthesis
MRLVYVGMLQYQIDVMPVLRALITRPHVTLTIIGDDGTGQRYPEVKEFVEKNKMTNVALVGRMDPDKVVDALAEHDIGVVPMISSSIPNKVFDYIAAYIPILSLGKNDTSRFVADNGIGWEAEFDSDSVGQVLDGLCPEKVLEKVRGVTSLRHLYERNNLYKPFIERIIGNRPTGPVTDSAVD